MRESVHISTLKIGDSVLHNDKVMTISKGDINRCDFMGLTLFGDSYSLGYKLITKVNYFGAQKSQGTS